MGRIKTKLAKRITNELVDEYGEDIQTSFEENKGVVSKNVKGLSKKLRNIISGYATRQKKKLIRNQ